jgi:O-antigen/teichoic acid export membrane protein
MKVNLLDAALSVVFAIALVPKMGIIGFVIALYLCEMLNCFFSFGMLTLTVRPKLSVFKAFIIPCASAILSTEVIRFLTSKGAVLTLILPLSLIAYCLILLACGALDVFTEMKAQKHCKAS